jgi:hypothetical protein
MSDTTKIPRRILPLRRPEVVYNERQVAALIADNLFSAPNPHDILLLTHPGNGTTTLLTEIQDLIPTLAPAVPNCVHLHVEGKRDARVAYTIRAIASKYLETPYLYLLAEWKSLRAREALTLLLIFASYLLVLNLLATWGLAFERDQPVAGDSASLKHLLVFSVTTIFGAVLPALAFYHWKSLSANHSLEAVAQKSQAIHNVFRRNGYRALLKIFMGQLIKTYGPVLLVIDSIDDLDEAFDKPFLFDHLIPALRRNYRVVVLAVSKLPTESRVQAQKNLQPIEMFVLDSPRREELVRLTGNPASGLSLKEALGGETVSHEKLRILRQNIARLSASYSASTLNTWTLLCLLASTSHLDRRGFTPAELDAAFLAQISLLNDLLTSTGIAAETTTSQISQTLTAFLQTNLANDMFIFSEGERKYFWDFTARRRVFENATPEWSLIGRIVWLAALFSEMGQNPTAWTCFELTQIARVLREEIAERAPGERVLAEIEALAASIVRSTSRSEYADLREACSALYFQARGLRPLPEAVSTEDAECFSALLLHGRHRLEDLAELNRQLTSAGGGCVLLSWVEQVSQAGSRPWPELLDKLPVAQPAEGEVGAIVRWMEAGTLRRTAILPMLLLGAHDPEWHSYQKLLPPIVGGFNLGTILALKLVSDASRLGRTDVFLRAWTALARGTIQLCQLGPTAWEKVWIEYLAACVVAEMIGYMSSADRDGIYDQDGFHLNIVMDAIDGEQRRLFAENAFLIGVEVPEDANAAVPIAALKSINAAFEEIRVKLLLLSLGDLANCLAIVRARFFLATSDVEDLQNSMRDDLLAELQRLAGMKPPLVRDTLQIEALLLIHQMNAPVHKSLGSESLILLVRELEDAGCARRIVDLVYDRHLQELRFSHSDELFRLAVRLLIRRLKRSEDLDEIRVSRLYSILATDLLKLRKLRGAKDCLRRADRALGGIATRLKDPDVLRRFREAEMQLFIARARVFNNTGTRVQRRTEKMLRDETYRKDPGNSFLLLLWWASGALPLEKMGVLVETVEEVERSDWYAGYIWSLLLQRLVGRILEGAAANGIVPRAMSAVVAKIQEADKSGIELEATIETLRSMFRYSPTAGIDGTLRALYEELMARQAAVNFGEALTIWMQGGTIGEVAFSYYRLVAPYVEDWLPAEIAAWSSSAEYPEFRDKGMKLIRSYTGSGDEASWMAIYVAGQLERRAKQSGDHELQVMLEGIWVQLGIACIQSLLKASIGNAALPPSLRILLRTQMEKFARRQMEPSLSA